ncbi:uncharacterized protein LOC125749541 [Brienomyrus brachyistius]|uniref:uncharacterized protein LOC125749541 n=1 Tax=Brienomyrus brachyistius TaxID=42636 RepID=UPI0020B3257D|nr:uncharacterized protein LOC125749541 [Brienomyrus brachyistius]
MSGPKGTRETGRDSTAEGEAEMSATPEHGEVPEQTKQRDRHLTLGTQEGLNASAKCSVGKTEHYDVRPCDVSHALQDHRRTTSDDPVHHVTSSKRTVGFISGCRTEEYAALLARNRDLEALQQEAVECRKRKPTVRQQAEEEAFRRYMKIVCNDPLCPETVLVPPGWVTGSLPLTPPTTRKSKKVKDGTAEESVTTLPSYLQFNLHSSQLHTSPSS